MQPIVLGPNMPAMFYRGDGRIDRLRGSTGHDDRPEDWIASVTARFGAQNDGKTRLPDGTLLAEAVASDPEAWLGTAHVAKYGSDTGLLVKLLDAGQRLPVHVHPDRSFAAEHLASPHGKTEAWVVLEAEPDAAVHLGFSRDVEAAELAGWARDQDIDAMLAVTNRVPVSAGDTVLCPAGTPHAISAGILVVELQEPADLSIMLEWSTFSLAEDEATLGLPLEEALACIDRHACPPERLKELQGRTLNSASARCCPPRPPRSSSPNGSTPRSATTCRRATACWCSPPAAATWPPRTGRRCRWAGAAPSRSRTRPARPYCPATSKACAACPPCTCGQRGLESAVVGQDGLRQVAGVVLQQPPVTVPLAEHGPGTVRQRAKGVPQILGQPQKLHMPSRIAAPWLTITASEPGGRLSAIRSTRHLHTRSAHDSGGLPVGRGPG